MGDWQNSDSLQIKVAITRFSLIWEALWPVFIAPLCLVGLYSAMSLINGWQALPGLVHWAAALGVIGASTVLLYRGISRIEWPDETTALRRIETRSGLKHRPLSALADAPANLHTDTTAHEDDSTTLWAAHLQKLEDAAARARAVAPRSLAPVTDIYALRALVFLLVVCALVYAGRDAPSRLAENLLPGAVFGVGTSIAFDAWVTPPAYTSVPPLFLNTVPRNTVSARASDNTDADDSTGTGPGVATSAAASAATGAIALPQGSVLTARVYGANSAEARLADTSYAFEGDVSGAHEIALPLKSSGTLEIIANGRVLDSFDIALIPDLKPQIDFTEGDALTVTAQMSLAVGYDLLDDYGITRAEMRVTLPRPEDVELGSDGTEGDGTATTQLGALAQIEPPTLKLPLPSARVVEAEGEFAYKDLTSHPWAGLQVAITLAAFDEAGQEGTSDPRIRRLPQRNFFDPVARAIIEQRQRLARKPDEAPEVATALNALTLHADRYYETAVDYLPLRAAYWRLKGASNEGDLDGIYELLWDIALHFEDGNLSLAETALRDAQDALMDALANGASDAEIDRLMNELRQAMDEFLQALAQQQMEAGENGDMSALPPNAQTLERGDLDSLLDALQDLAQSGSRDAARQLLSELRQMMENLATGTPGQMNMTPPQSAMNDAIGQMGEIIDQQRNLQDQTVQQGNDGEQGEQGPPNGSPGGSDGGLQRGQRGDSGQSGGTGAGSDLQQQQEGVRGELGRLREALEGSGVDTPSALGRADRAMRDAEEALRSGDLDKAARKQGEAIENLRDGAQALAETLLEDLAMGEAQGQDRGAGAEGRDPLGRSQRTTGPQRGDGVEVPDESDVQRARRILEELQRRAGDRSRPPVELDYLNRLLQRF